MGRIILGEGTVAVTDVEQDGIQMMVLESGLGTGVIDGPVPARLPNTEISIEDLDNADCVIEFHNPESVQVVINCLERIKGYLTTFNNQ